MQALQKIKNSKYITWCLLAAVLWSCGQGDQQSPPPKAAKGIEDIYPQGQKVTFWYQHTDEREAALLELIAAFNQNNPHSIQVQGQHMGTYNDIYNEMQKAIHSGAEMPQLVVAYRYQALDYYHAAAAVDLAPYMDAPKWGLSTAERADYVSAFLNQDNIDGVQVAFLPNRSMEILYYNADWLKELGYEGPPRTWDEFAAMCRQAKTKPFSKSSDKSRSLGFLMTVDASRLASMVFSRGGDLLDKDGTAYTLTTPQIKTSLTLVRDLIEEGAAALLKEAYDAQDEFAAGQVLFVMRSSSGLPLYQEAVKKSANFAWDVAPVPYEGYRPVLNVYGASLAVCKSTPEQQLATWLFIKWFTEPEQQERWVQGSNYFPVRKSTARQLQSYFRTAYELIDFGKPEPSIVGYERVRGRIEAAMVDILQGGEMDPILAKLEQEANQTTGHH